MGDENHSTNSTADAIRSKRDFYIGLCLALTSTIFIGSSFIIKKVGLTRHNGKGLLRAGSGGFGYLKEWIWWIGLITMGIGELANFAAYAFAPASLVTPLGALSVLISTILASKYLNERLNTFAKVGCVLCILGSTIIILHSSNNESIVNLDDLLSKLTQTTFIVYIIFVVINLLAVSFYFGPKYGDKNIFVYIGLCSSIGSLTVITCKTLGLALKDTITRNHHTNMRFVSLLIVTVIVCILIQMNYLNKALDLYNTSIVTPVYYVFFTTFVIIASSIVFKEWWSMALDDLLGNICGFFIIIIAVFMLNGMKDLSDVNFMHVLRPKYELLRNDKQHYQI